MKILCGRRSFRYGQQQSKYLLQSNSNGSFQAYPSLPLLTRSQLLDDAMNLARVGQLDYNIALEITRNFAGEDELVVIKTFQKNIEFLEHMISEDERYDSFKTYIRNGLNDLYNQVL